MATLPLTIALAVGIGVLLHWWPRLSAAWRLRLSLATSAAGVAFLVAAVQAEGRRESALTSLVLVGPSTLTATASASAGLHYYVLTAFCLLLGFAGLAFGDALARWLSAHCLASAVAVAGLVTAMRFLLEKSAAPGPLVAAMGVTWLAPIAGVHLATGPCPGTAGRRAFVRDLVAYALLVRGFVAAVGIVATRHGLGTHYDVSALTSVPIAATGITWAFVPGSWPQVLLLTLLPQLVLWPVYTVLVGLPGPKVAALLAPRRPAPPAGAPPPARDDASRAS